MFLLVLFCCRCLLNTLSFGFVVVIIFSQNVGRARLAAAEPCTGPLLLSEDAGDDEEEEHHVVRAGGLITLVTPGVTGEGPGPGVTKQFSLSHPVTNRIRHDQ